MGNHSKKIHMQTNDNTPRIISEIISINRSCITSIERHNVFEYVQGMAKELSDISTKADNSFLSYLLSLAVAEAQLAKRAAGRAVSAS